MIENATTTTTSAQRATTGVVVADKPSSVIKTIKAAIRDTKNANRWASGEAYVERVTDRVDRAYALPIATLAEAEAMLRLVLASDGEVIDEPILTALKSVAVVLENCAKRSAEFTGEAA